MNLYLNINYSKMFHGVFSTIEIQLSHYLKQVRAFGDTWLKFTIFLIYLNSNITIENQNKRITILKEHCRILYYLKI